MQNSFVWKVATLSLKFPDSARKPIPDSPFAAKKEIQHIFRLPEKRPPLAISSAFTLAVLAPWAILFFGVCEEPIFLINFSVHFCRS